MHTTHICLKITAVQCLMSCYVHNIDIYKSLKLEITLSNERQITQLKAIMSNLKQNNVHQCEIFDLNYQFLVSNIICEDTRLNLIEPC